jgi:hypothetical protein
VAFVAVAGGCTGRGKRPESGAPVADSAAVQAWSRSDLKPIGQFVGVAGVAVGYITDSTTRLYLIGVDPATGNVLWKKDASPGEVTLGIGITPTIIGERITYFRPDPKGDLYARLILADPRTGADIAATGPALFSSSPQPCSNKVDVCTASRDRYDRSALPYRLRAADGKYVRENPGIPAGARSIGEKGLLDFGGRNPEMMGLVREGRLLWKRPLADAFPPGFSSDNGWDWQLFPAQHVYAGSVYGEVGGSEASGFTMDLATLVASAGLSEADGTVLWRDPGSLIGCFGTLLVAVNPDDRDSPIAPARCRYRGTETWPPGKDTTATFTGLDVTIEGFDVTTGKVTWSQPVGAAESLTGQGQHPALAGPGRIVVATGDGPIILDLTNGNHQKAANDATFWCPTTFKFTYREPYYSQGTPNYTRYGGQLGAICDTNGKPATRVPGTAAARTFGAHVGSVAIVATAGGLTGYRVG